MYGNTHSPAPFTLSDIACLAVGGNLSDSHLRRQFNPRFPEMLARIIKAMHSGEISCESEAGDFASSTVRRESAVTWLRKESLPVPAELDGPVTIEEANGRYKAESAARQAAEAALRAAEARVRQLDLSVQELKGQLDAPPGEFNAANASKSESTLLAIIGALTCEACEPAGRLGRVNGGTQANVSYATMAVARRCGGTPGTGEDNVRRLLTKALAHLKGAGASIAVSLPAISRDLRPEAVISGASSPKCEGPNTEGTDKCKPNTKRTTAGTRHAATPATQSRKSAPGSSIGTTSTS